MLLTNMRPPIILAQPGLKRLLPWFTHQTINAKSMTRENITLPIDMTDLYVAQLTDTCVIAATALLRSESTAISFVEPDFLTHPNNGPGGLSGTSASSGARQAPSLIQTFPNDQFFPNQWWLVNTGQYGGTPGVDINLQGYWGPFDNMPVAILDTGMDLGHPDFFQIMPGPNFVSGGLPEDDSPLSSGTADAGIIAAQGNDSIGVAGVSWILFARPVKVLSGNGLSSVSLITQGIDWARQNGIPLVCLNAHFLSNSSILAQAFKNAHAAGVLTAVGSGTENANILTWPAAFVNFTEGVGAFMQNNARWTDASDPWCSSGSGLGSPWGAHVAIAGPGSNEIVTTASRFFSFDGYYDGAFGQCGYSGGTASAAAAIVGVAALVRAASPNLSGEDITEVLNRTAVDIGAPGRDDVFGNGRVNSAAAVGLVCCSHTVERGSSSNSSNTGIVGSPFGATLHDVPGLADGTYLVEMYDVRSNIQFANSFVAIPVAWGRKANSIGWRPLCSGCVRAHLEEPVGWVEVLPGSVTRTGLTLRTYAFKVYTVQGPVWYPSDPNLPMTMAYTAVGFANPTGASGSQANLSLRITAYPNPASRGGDFEFTLPKTATVSLQVFSVDGRLVGEVTRGTYAAGVHRVRWSGLRLDQHPLPTGVYFYRLTANRNELKGKLVVVK